MFLTNSLQQDGTNPVLNVLAISILVILILILIWFLINRGRSKPSESQQEQEVAYREVTKEKVTPDDLTKIEGIGPKVARVLNEAGISTFEQLAGAKPADVQKELNAAGLQMMNPEGWIEQADLAAKGDWEQLERLQSELKGGRKK